MRATCSAILPKWVINPGIKIIDGDAMKGKRGYRRVVVIVVLLLVAIGAPAAAWGAPGTYADFDGDGQSDLIIWRPEFGFWAILPSANNFDPDGFLLYQLGLPGDIPLLGDFDADGRTDLAIWRNTDGNWAFRLSKSSYRTIVVRQWGLPGDKPFVLDYNGDGHDDLAVFRPEDGSFYVLPITSSGGAFSPAEPVISQLHLPGQIQFRQAVFGVDENGDGTESLASVQSFQGGYFWSRLENSTLTSLPWGVSATDTPLRCDIDGDGRDDRVVVRASWEEPELKWFAAHATGAVTAHTFGTVGDRVSCAYDFDGDGRADLATIDGREVVSVWRIRRSTDNAVVKIQFGLGQDLIPATSSSVEQELYDGEFVRITALLPNTIATGLNNKNEAVGRVGQRFSVAKVLTGPHAGRSVASVQRPGSANAILPWLDPFGISDTGVLTGKACPKDHCIGTAPNIGVENTFIQRPGEEPILIGWSTPRDIDRDGTVVGCTLDNTRDNRQAYVVRDGVLSLLAPGANISCAAAVDGELTAGSVQFKPHEPTQAFVYSEPSGLQVLPIGDDRTNVTVTDLSFPYLVGRLMKRAELQPLATEVDPKEQRRGSGFVYNLQTGELRHTFGGNSRWSPTDTFESNHHEMRKVNRAGIALGDAFSTYGGVVPASTELIWTFNREPFQVQCLVPRPARLRARPGTLTERGSFLGQTGEPAGGSLAPAIFELKRPAADLYPKYCATISATIEPSCRAFKGRTDTCTIRGTMRNGDGQPVANARILLERQQVWDKDSSNPGREYQEIQGDVTDAAGNIAIRVPVSPNTCYRLRNTLDDSTHYEVRSDPIIAKDSVPSTCFIESSGDTPF